MPISHAILIRACLWLFVIAAGIQTGAGLYEAVVTASLWSALPPDAIREPGPGPALLIDPSRFWIVAFPAYAILTIAISAAAFLTRAPIRRWLIVAAIAGTVVILSTIFYFVPVLIETIYRHGRNLSDAEIVTALDRWQIWNWLRILVTAAGWLASLRALQISHSPPLHPTPRH